jgi:cruciform cutting endonuclease 1
MPVARAIRGGLAGRTLAQLQRLAVAAGISVSGTKPTLIARLQNEIIAPHATAKPRTRPSCDMRILSIDMGIRNLAYAFLIAPEKSQSDPTPILEGWKRVVIASKSDIQSKEDALSTGPTNFESSTTTKETIKESFDPATYATHAYCLVTGLLDRFKPTHILIERQRFRSGGSSAVQEWTIRVGVFEGMIYAVLETLRSLGQIQWHVESVAVDPGKVARYWIANAESGVKTNEDLLVTEGKRRGSRARGRSKTKDLKGKQAKIAVVRSWLDEGAMALRMRLAVVDARRAGVEEVQKTVANYLQAGSRTRSGKTSGKGQGKAVKKLDDLADCLLQGVAWIEWQRMREQVTQEGWEEVMAKVDSESG